jgi:hypothetical protein
MRIRIFFAIISAFLAAGLLRAQDAGLPALPPLPGQDSAAPAAVPASQVVDLSLGTPKSAKELEKQRKEEAKVLQEQEKLKEKEAKEKAKELEKINKDRKKQGLPPLEATAGQETTSVPAAEKAADKKEMTKAEEKAAKEKAKELEKLNKKRKKEGLPLLDVLPGEEIAPDTTKLPGLPGQETAPAEPVAAPAAAAEKPKGSPAPMKKWKQPDFGPNVIFGGYVKPKGTNLDERLAWASQEVLNTMDFNGYDFKKENGAYAGQGAARQWREFSFKSRRDSKAHPVTVAVEPGPGGKIFLRVGPSEPPAGVPALEVRKIRAQNEKVMRLFKKKLKSRLTPIRRGWEAPYHRTAS